MTRNPPILAVTPGEPAGIGPEILIRFHHEFPHYRLLAVADPGLLSQTAGYLGLNTRIRVWQPGVEIIPGELACLPVNLAATSKPGRLNLQNANYVLATLRAATRLIQDNHAAALVTGPVHKGIINESGFAFSGHTEFLADLAGVPQVVMMLAVPGLRVALVTTHLPLREVADAIRKENLDSVIRITHRALRELFGIDHPRLQILGLNPHAGEGGHLGHEENDIMVPLIGQLRAEGMALDGPVPADTAFNPSRIAECDAVVAMYHDQGLPVLKHMGFGQGVNITLGLPFIRTSVDHGTALDLAGTGKADPASLCAAVRAAEKMALQKSAITHQGIAD